MPELMNTIMADGPSPNPSQPIKAQMRAWGTWVEGIITAFTSNGGLIYDTKAHMDADLLHAANSMAWVLGDATLANNVIYRKLGASGAGSWTRIADLPYSYIKATDAGAGTPNAIVATSSIPLPAADAGALIAVNVFKANTGSPVTVAFNGGAALTVKTSSGNDVVAGGLMAGMVVAGYKSGTTFRLISDQASAAIQAASEAAAAAAASSATAAAGSATAAAASAASVNLPPVVANAFLQGKPDASGYNAKTPTQVRPALGIPYINVVTDFGAKADVVSITGNVSITSGAAALAVTGAAFTVGDIGKSIFVPGAGAAGAMLATTISGFTDATHVTLSANAGTTLAAASKTVKYWTNQAGPFQNAINAAVAVKGTVFIPAGNYGFDGANAGMLDPGAGGISFIGEGKSILTYFEGENSAMRYLFKSTSNGAKGSLYFGPGICFQGTLDAYGRRAGNPLWLDYYSAVLLDGVEWNNIAGEAMDFHFCGEFSCINGRMYNIAADGVRVRDTPNCYIANNYILRNGDDAIAVHTSDGSATGSREGVIIANNHIVNAGTIKVLGGRVVHVTGNRIELGNIGGISVSNAPTGLEGNYPLRDIVIENNIILDLLYVAAGVASDAIANAIVISANPAQGQASTHSTKPGRYDATAAAWVYPWTYDEVDGDSASAVVPPADGFVIAGNIIKRTRPAVAAFSTYGFGTRLWQGVAYDPAITDGNLRSGSAIGGFTGSFVNVLVIGNIVECAASGFTLPTPTYELQHENIVLFGNVFRDILNFGVNVTAAFNVDMTIDSNIFDMDPYRANANSNVNGSYAALGLPRGVNIGNARGVRVTRNKFKNTCLAIQTNLPAQMTVKDNVLIGMPAAVGFSTSNKGIGNVEFADGRYVYEIIDADPTSATYGANTNVQQVSATAMPATGTYVQGAFVCNSSPTQASGIEGWLRLSTGNAHVLGTDWMIVGGRLTGTATFDPVSLADGVGVTTTVTVAGAALGDAAVASFSLDTQGITITAWVSSANTVSVRFQNESGGVLDIASGTLKATVFR
ncbi:right-handed parallel beta-helix repeat-containing protein [Mesorhizobium sp. B2-3-3]|nr:right-handed parallel beta-helix repeat-containing protein [Mesorhizobium sp. B2-3-3]